ncbi:MAG: hypothetical protein HOI23_14760 [Deltaproteobacteria bacterium]|nr:hypothetical protein [Deltaproteobacteria bacterium]
MVEIEPIEVVGDLKEVRGLITLHYRHTGSEVAKTFLDNWDARLKEIVRVMPLDYKRVLRSRTDDRTMRGAFDGEVAHG